VRIVMLVHNTIARGTFNRAHSLGRHLVARGHEVTLLAGASVRAKRQRRNLNGVEVLEAFDPLPGRARESGLSPFDLLSRMCSLRRERYDLLHCFDHRPTVSLPALFFANKRQIPCVVDWADLWGFEGIASQRGLLSRALLGGADQFLEDRVRHRADALTVINTKLRDRARQRFHVPIHLLPVGANSDLIQPLPKKEMRRRFGLPENAAIALHAGLSPYDIEYLAKSFVELVRQHPGALLVIAGRRFPILDRIVAEAGFSSQLVRLGMLDREALTAAMACADVLFLPYTNRTVNLYRYPNKLGDYLCAGRPIVTNDTGDLGRLVAEERVGLVVPDTTQAFALAAKQLFDDAALADELGRRARALAESKLDWRFLARDLEILYDQILAARR
jgi:glycosyltransferase involved in cell wall biosynthesis